MKTFNFAGDAETALRIVRECKDLIYDTETSGVDWKRNHTVGYVLGDTNNINMWVPVRCGGGGNLLDWKPLDTPTEGFLIHPFEQELAKAFKYRNDNKIGITVGHNLKFDAHFSANSGIMLGRDLYCTQNVEALLDEFARSYSLDACCAQHKVSAKKGKELYEHIAKKFGCAAERSAMEHYWRLSGDDPISVDYAVGDGVSTGALYKSQVREIEADHKSTLRADGTERSKSLKFIANIENQLIWTVFKMERTGIKVNTEYLDRLERSVNDEVNGIKSRLPKDFNPRSPNSVKKLCIDAGRTDWPLTEKGNPSYTEEFLSSFDEGKVVVELRQMTNLLNSFAMPLAKEHTFNGRVHANLNQMRGDDYGTISGRFSCNAPNLQQIPSRNKKISKAIREAFIADAGYVFVEVDAKAQEPRAFAHYSEDPNLVAGYFAKPSIDVHTAASKLLGLEREMAKRLNMGIFTGMQAPTLSDHLGVDISVGRDLFTRWFNAFPQVKSFQDTAKNAFAERGYVRTILGRLCRLESRKFAYRATSRIIQGFGADYIKLMLLLLDLECERTGLAQLLMTVHDSIVWQHADTQEGKAFSYHLAAMMCDVQVAPLNLAIPFEAEYHQGYTWAEAKHGIRTEFNKDGPINVH